MDENEIELACSLLESCSLPKLDEDFDTFQLKHEDYADYHNFIESIIPGLLKFFNKNKLYGFTTTKLKKLLAKAVVLFCDVTTTDEIHKMNNDNMVAAVSKLMNNDIKIDDETFQMISTYYKSILLKDKWKRFPYKIHGFLEFLNYYHINLKNIMTEDWMNFCLSVGLNVRDCVEPDYKICGLLIFHNILTYSDLLSLREFNVHAVIYDNISSRIAFMDSANNSVLQWRCLYDTLKCLPEVTSNTFEWNKVDDFIELILSKIQFAQNTEVLSTLLRFLAKAGCFLSPNKDDMNELIDNLFTGSKVIKRFRNAAVMNNSYNPHRWAKKLLCIMIDEAYRLQENKSELITAMHSLYLCCIFNINIHILGRDLILFYESMIPVLLESLKLHNNLHIDGLIRDFLDTFYFHIIHTNNFQINSEFLQIASALTKILVDIMPTNNSN